MNIRHLAVVFAPILAAVSMTGVRTAAYASSNPKAATIRLLPSDAMGRELPGPGYYNLRVKPGQTVRLFASIANSGNKTAHVKVVPVDAQSAVYGGVAYNLPTQPRRLVGDWIHLQENSLKLAPSTSKVVAFTVRVPAHISSGTHVGGLTAYVPVASNRSHNFGSLTVQLRVIAAVVLHVSGPSSARLRVVRVTTRDEPTGLYALVHIRNSGQQLTPGRFLLRMLPLGMVPLHGREPILDRTFPVDKILPETGIAYPIRWPAEALYGPYRVSARLTWSGGSDYWSGRLAVGAPPAQEPKPAPRPGAPQATPGGAAAVPSHTALGFISAIFLLLLECCVALAICRMLIRRMRFIPATTPPA